MNTTTIYPYANGQRLADRNTYTYTPYVGQPMLDAWQISRDKTRSTLNDPQIEKSRIIGGKRPVLNLPDLDSPVETQFLLKSLSQCDANRDDSTAMGWVELLLHKFETTKRLHDNYDRKFRAIDASAHENMDLYIQWASILCQFYTELRDIRYLNCLLKVMDTLCAYSSQLDETNRYQLRLLIDNESAFVKELSDLANESA